eukprot:1325391-Rhodomonas_salina.1
MCGTELACGGLRYARYAVLSSRMDCDTRDTLSELAYGRLRYAAIRAIRGTELAYAQVGHAFTCNVISLIWAAWYSLRPAYASSVPRIA